MKNKRPSTVFSVIVSILVFIVVQSCVDHSFPPASEYSQYNCSSFKEVSFDVDIEPIINAKCAIVGDGGCHNGGNGADLDWRVFNNFQSHASNVEYRVTRPAGAPDHMPKLGSISEDQIKLLVCWVEQGAQDN